ncbi:MAG: site-specific integrase, partial [[Bacteroides] pectinophilus]|nr:site-specific integrase [[Bacteroides] pectinophilus]
KASTIKKSSYVKYNNMLRYYLYPEFKNTFIDEITYENVNNLTNVLLTTAGNKGTGLSPKTVQCVVSLLNQILSYASHYYTDLHLSIPGITVKQEQKVLRVLSPQEQQRLTIYLYDNMELCNLGILVCMYSGLRIGELCALRWENILWNEQCIYVKETMQRLQNTDTSDTLISKTSIVISAPKSACSIRKIPIPEQLFSLLKMYECESSTFLMTGTKSYIEPRTLQYRFKRITEKCNIYDIKFHSLRHTFATRCVELGFDIKSLSEILGHANVNITLNRYVHPSMEQKQKNMNLLSELLIVR